jgi:FkbM family methyltransferase
LRRAISDENREADINLTPAVNSGASGFTRVAKYTLPSESVKVRNLSSILEQLSIEKVDLLKVDVEGHEYEVIMGAKKVFQEQTVESIALELHPKVLSKKGQSAREIKVFLQKCGYEYDNRFENIVLTSQSY